MTTSTVVYIGKLQTELKHTKSGQIIITDAPVDNNGKGAFFSPTDLCATSLASCMLTIMGIKAESMGVDLGRIDVEVYKIMAAAPRRISEIKLNVRVAGKYSDAEMKTIEAAGRNCPVAKSLHPELMQTIDVVWTGA
jgi:uncharacterized OsmC-like protein